MLQRCSRVEPHTSIRDIARRTEISLATALDVRRRVDRGEDPVPHGLTRAGRGIRSGSRRREAARRNQARDPHSVLQVLKADPALKSSQRGRDLLRWLYFHAPQKTQCDDLLKNVPPHCTDLIADLTESYSEISGTRWQGNCVTLFLTPWLWRAGADGRARGVGIT